MGGAFHLRPYRPDDYEHAIGVWLRAWQRAMPEIAFAKRLEWWRERWQRELVPSNTIIIAESDGAVIGFLVIDPANGWLDQIAVEPLRWGDGIADALVAEAKRISPRSVRLDVNQSNKRAVRFYERAGFVRIGDGVNSRSGAATHLYEWKP
jgi:putative acetyltransferase